MLRTVLLATSMLVAAPAFAQDKPATTDTQTSQDTPSTATAGTTAPATDDAAPDATEAPAAAPQTTPAPNAETAQPTPARPTPAEPAPAQSADGTMQQSPNPAAGQTVPAQSASAQPAPAAQPAASQDQVAQAVGRDFGTYDKDADGMLNATEFAAWMGTLRKASEPSFVPDSPEAKSWASQAFTSADADKNAGVNKQELTAFLTPKPS